MALTKCILPRGLSKCRVPDSYSALYSRVQTFSRKTLAQQRSSFVPRMSKDYRSAVGYTSFQTFRCHWTGSCHHTAEGILNYTRLLIPSHHHISRTSLQHECDSQYFLETQNPSFVQTRGFHTTPQRNIPPVFWLLFKPVAKLGAILSGRSARKWWQSLSRTNRQQFWKQVRERWYIIALLTAGLGGIGLLYYRSHVEETPITGRRRYIAVTHDQFIKISNTEADMQLKNYEDKLLPIDHPYYERVLRVGNRLVNSNPVVQKLMGSNTWKCYVIDEPNTINAQVLPTGQIFVFTGILEFAENDDQLAVVIAHEMAHGLLSHGVEHVSYLQLLDFFIIASMAALWCIMPSDGISLITQWFHNKMIAIMLHMPYSRMLEKEADKVGLELAARACYDVREGSVFWSHMGLNDELTNDSTPEWLSTHPSHEKRVELLDDLIPKAVRLREKAKCPQLPAKDPREAVKVLSALVDEHLKAKKNGQNLTK